MTISSSITQIIVTLLVICVAASLAKPLRLEPPTVLGLVSDTKGSDDKIKAVVQKVKQDFETKTGRTYSLFLPVDYREQFVTGWNYFVKVQIGIQDYVHLRIHQDLPAVNHGRTRLDSFLLNRGRDDFIDTFA